MARALEQSIQQTTNSPTVADRLASIQNQLAQYNVYGNAPLNPQAALPAPLVAPAPAG